jgi:tetratricopeptide (TPR) repeat protein
LSREVAGKLKAAGALDEAAALYEQYLGSTSAPVATRASIAYSLGTTYMDRGRYERALRWLYEAEVLDSGELSPELGQKIVHSLERMGRYHSAQAALDSRVQFAPQKTERPADDPVVARIGESEIHRSDVERALDDLPPDLARSLAAPEAQQEFLRKFVADELLWRKASKLEYPDDPEVRRRHAALLKELVVGKFVEREILAKIEVDEADLRTYFEANRQRYEQKQEGETTRQPAFEEVRPLVERDYRLFKMQAVYQTVIEAELAAEEVEVYPERMLDES